MCLGIPGQVESVSGSVATVDFGDVAKQVRLDVVDEPVEPGDYVLNHAGFAIRKIPTAEALATIETYEELLSDADRLTELGEDLEGQSESRKEPTDQTEPIEDLKRRTERHKDADSPSRQTEAEPEGRR